MDTQPEASHASNRPARIARRTALLAACATVGALVASGCSITRVLDATTPSGGASIMANDFYGPDTRNGVDVYQPRPSGRPAPVVVFIYGGSWQSGERGMYGFVGKALASKGFLTFIPDYRVYPQAKYPDFLRDNAAAVRWVRDNAARFGGDPRQLFLIGHSAGAYNVAMLALDGRWLEEVGLEPGRDLRGVVGLAGPYDFLPLKDETHRQIFGPEPGLAATQPINHVSRGAPPLLLAAGTGDKTVDPGNSERLAARLGESGDEVELKLYRRINHTQIIGAIAAPLRPLAPTLKDAVTFMRAHEGPPGAQPTTR